MSYIAGMINIEILEIFQSLNYVVSSVLAPFASPSDVVSKMLFILLYSKIHKFFFYHYN